MEKIKERVRQLVKEKLALHDQAIELKCLLLEREKILDSIAEYVDDEEITSDVDAEWMAEVILEKTKCRTKIEFSVINKNVVAEKKEENVIQKRLNNIGSG
jgi:hypothetical protein